MASTPRLRPRRGPFGPPALGRTDRPVRVMVSLRAARGRRRRPHGAPTPPSSPSLPPKTASGTAHANQVDGSVMACALLKGCASSPL